MEFLLPIPLPGEIVAEYQVEFVGAHADDQVEFVDNFPGCD